MVSTDWLNLFEHPLILVFRCVRISFRNLSIYCSSLSFLIFIQQFKKSSNDVWAVLWVFKWHTSASSTGCAQHFSLHQPIFFVCHIFQANQVAACEQHATRLAQTSAYGRKVRPEIGHLLRNATNVRASPFIAHIAQVASFTAKFKKFVWCEWPRKLCQASRFAVVWPKAHANAEKLRPSMVIHMEPWKNLTMRIFLSRVWTTSQRNKNNWTRSRRLGINVVCAHVVYLYFIYFTLPNKNASTLAGWAGSTWHPNRVCIYCICAWSSFILVYFFKRIKILVLRSRSHVHLFLFRIDPHSLPLSVRSIWLSFQFFFIAVYKNWRAYSKHRRRRRQ